MGIPGVNGHKCVAGPSGLLSVGVEMNRSDLRSDGVMNQLVKRGNNHTVETLVEHASDPTAMAASEEFLDVWQELESELIAAQATSGSAALQPLRRLLGQLPVGHIDKASAFRVDGDLPLLELCAFSVVAASVEKNFPEEAGLVHDARALLSSRFSSPTPEQRSRFTGLEADLDEFFDWIDAGKPADGVRKYQTSLESPDRDEDYRDWLLMMAKEHECDSRGRPSFVPLDDAELDDDDDDDEIMVESGSDWVSSSGDGESVFSSEKTEVDHCIDEWLLTDVAERLMEFLQRELPSE